MQLLYLRGTLMKFTILSITATLLLSACAPQATQPTPANSPEEATPTTISVSHMSGVTEVPINPQNVMVFDMGMLDTMDALGLSYRVVGLPMSSLPERLAHFGEGGFHDLGTLHEPNFEEIIRHDVDLIIISGRARPHFDDLSQIAPTIDLGLNINDMLNSFLQNNNYIAQIFGVEEEMELILADIFEQISEVGLLASQLENNRTLTLLYNEGQLSAFGSLGRFGIINDSFGFASSDPQIEIINHGMLVSNEYVVSQDPAILFIIDRNYAVGLGEISYDDIENELIQLTTAYQLGNIFYLTGEVWYISPGGIQGMQIQIDDMRNAVLSAS